MTLKYKVVYLPSIILFVLALLVLSFWAFLHGTPKDNDQKFQNDLRVRALADCPLPPSDLEEKLETGRRCIVLPEEDGLDYRWCLPSGKFPNEPEDQAFFRMGQPNERYTGTTEDEENWNHGWNIGRIGENPWLRILRPVSVWTQCVATADPGRGSSKDSQKPEKGSRSLHTLVVTAHVPDRMYESYVLLFVVFFCTVTAVFWLIAVHSGRVWEIAAVRHDLRNMLQTFELRVHKHLIINENTNSEDDIGKLVGDVIRDMVLIVDPNDSYRQDTVKMNLHTFLDVLASGVEDRNVAVTLDCPFELAIECWKIPLGRAFENLFLNAVRAAHAADSGRMCIRVRRHAQSVQITVGNNGDCFPSHVLKNFKRRPFSLRLRTGGIGLTVVREVVRKHGGTVMLRNLPRREQNEIGAQAEIVLPVGRSAPR